MRFRTLLFLLLFAFLALPIWAQKAEVFTVNDVGDTNDARPGDNICADSAGRCTLRASIEESNANWWTSDAVIFDLPQPSTITLTQGELSIRQGISILGPGARRLTVQRSYAPGTPLFRVFHIGEFNMSGGTTANIRGMTIRNGRIEGSLFGGGILVERQNSLNLTDVTVRDNFALYGGGLEVEGTAVVSRCLFTGNRGNNHGGAIYVGQTQARTTITNTTITGNVGGTSGALDNAGDMLLVNNTISRNSGEYMVTSVYNRLSGTMRVLNTIIANDNLGAIATVSGAFTSLGNNLVADARSSSGFTNGVNNDQVSNNNDINPFLDTLGDNGGQTDTLALYPGSPAINAGNDCMVSGTCGVPPRFAWDQRQGYSRKIDSAVDIGAFENTYSASSAPWSTGHVRVGYPGAFYAGSVAILINIRSGERRYARVRPSGYVSFDNLDAAEVYLLDIRTKRQTVYFTPQIVEQLY